MNKSRTLAGILLLIWFAVYFSTLRDMVSVWMNSTTYTYGFFIPIISGYLIWEKRDQLALQPGTTIWLPLLALLGAQAIWLLGNLAGVNLIQQLAAYVSLNALVLYCVGWSTFRVILFPMAYLIFAVPMGEELVPYLQEITADISVFLLKLINVPIYREGLYLYIPNGIFEVAEACAGIRFLIAAVALGTMFAYTFYQSWWKRGIFFGVSILVPIIANGIRAFGIVYLGYVSDMTVAVGADHLVYGWFFFALIIVLLLWIGSRFQDPPSKATHQAPSRVSVYSVKFPSITFTVLVLLAPLAFLFNLQNSQDNASSGLKTAQLEQISSPIEQLRWEPSFAQAHSIYRGALKFEGIPVQLYIADYQYDADGSELVHTSNRPFNIERYTNGGYEHRTIHDTHLTVRELISVAPPNLTQLSWYQIGSKTLTNPLNVKVAQLVDKLTGGNGAGQFVAIVFPQQRLTEKQVQTLVRSLQPSLLME